MAAFGSSLFPVATIPAYAGDDASGADPDLAVGLEKNRTAGTRTRIFLPAHGIELPQSCGGAVL